MNKYFWISIVSFAVAFLGVFLDFVVVILPLYRLVGDNLTSDQALNNAVLYRSQNLAYVFNSLIIIGIVSGIVCLIIGISKHAKKSKH